jgi:hypothetical protein
VDNLNNLLRTYKGLRSTRLKCFTCLTDALNRDFDFLGAASHRDVVMWICSERGLSHFDRSLAWVTKCRYVAKIARPTPTDTIIPNANSMLISLL